MTDDGEMFDHLATRIFTQVAAHHIIEQCQGRKLDAAKCATLAIQWTDIFLQAIRTENGPKAATKRRHARKGG